jgi:uncharacterized protein YndB with AHSA1/START domain
MTDQQTETAEALHLTERIAAPRETVFEFLVDPEMMLRWMGTEVELEPEPGGKFWLKPTGTDIASGTYVEVDPPNRVVFTWGWEGSSEVPPGSSTVTITLTTDGDDTVVDLVHAGLPGGSDDEHSKGWTYFVGRLVIVAAGGEVDPPDTHPG